MDHDGVSQLLPVAIPALATIIVAYISVRGGHRAAKHDAPFEAQEHGEHAHTRDVLLGRLDLWGERITDRLDRADMARGMARQSDQLGVSQQRLDERAGREGNP